MRDFPARVKKWLVLKIARSMSEIDLLDLSNQITIALEKIRTFCRCSCGYINSPDDWDRHFKDATEQDNPYEHIRVYIE